MSIKPVVYIVDDDISVRESLGNLMRSVGLNVEMFASALEYRRKQATQGSCCLVLDVRLPGMSGLDLQSEMRASGDFTPIVMITGHGDVPMSVRAMKAGALEFLQKPFREQDLLDAIHLALEKSSNQLLALSQEPASDSAGAQPLAAPAVSPSTIELLGNAREIEPRTALARNVQMGRTVFDWSQEDLGGKCKLNRSHISALERKELSVGVDAIDRIAAAFGIEPHVLLMSPGDAQAELLRAFNKQTSKAPSTPRTINKL